MLLASKLILMNTKVENHQILTAYLKHVVKSVAYIQFIKVKTGPVLQLLVKLLSNNLFPIRNVNNDKLTVGH